MKEGDLILGTVEKVSNTVTIVNLPEGKKGTLISSEIAPGRIKFLREYVVPNKKIVCKILKIDGENIQLSLRRVNSKEKKEVMQHFKQEHAINLAFKQILKESEEKIKEKILKDFKSLIEFVNESREDTKLLEKYIPKEFLDQIEKIVNKKRKQSELKHIVKLKCLESNGLEKIKKVLDIKKEHLTISYISAGKFKLTLLVEDFKEGKKKMNEIIELIQKNSKENKCEFSEEELK